MELRFTPVEPPLYRTRAYFAELWDAVEREHSVRITLHDHAGRLMLSDGAMLREKGNIHACAYCRFLRKHQVDACINHCHWRIVREAARIAGPFVHRCHAGAVELVLPLMVRNEHLATVFAGTFRDAETEPSPGWPVRQKELYRQLPVWRESALPGLLRTLQMFGAAALAFAEEERFHARKGRDRRAEIEAFFQHSVGVRDIGLGDLASQLGLSPSRTSHVLREEFQKTFSEMLSAFRVRAACRLLAAGELSIRQIALLTGFNDEYYFSRIFRRETGLPPGRYRDRGRLLDDFRSAGGQKNGGPLSEPASTE